MLLWKTCLPTIIIIDVARGLAVKRFVYNEKSCEMGFPRSACEARGGSGLILAIIASPGRLVLIDAGLDEAVEMFSEIDVARWHVQLPLLAGLPFCPADLRSRRLYNGDQ